MAVTTKLISTLKDGTQLIGTVDPRMGYTGGDGHSGYSNAGVGYDKGEISFSADGRYVVFTSSAVNVPGETNDYGSTDIYWKDLLTGELKVVSNTASVYNADNFTPVISNDGRYVAFVSDDPLLAPLTPGMSLGGGAIFRIDTTTGEAKILVSAGIVRPTYPVTLRPDMSADGRYIVFESGDSQMIAGETMSYRQIYLTDVNTGTVTLVSSDSQGLAGNNYSYHASISDDGRYVVFESNSTNLVNGDTNGRTDIFLKDTQTGAIKLISAGSDGNSQNASISGNGKYVVFESKGKNLVSGLTMAGTTYQVYRANVETGVIELVSRPLDPSILPDQDTNGLPQSINAQISDDGRYVSFVTRAMNFDGTPGVTYTSYSPLKTSDHGAYVKDMNTGALTALDPNGQFVNNYPDFIALSGNGAYAAFSTKLSMAPEPNTVSDPNSKRRDLFLVDLGISGSENGGGGTAILGTESAEKLSGTVADEVITGLGGNDTLDGGSGNDVLDGGSGVDQLKGGSGDDIYYLDLIKVGTGAAGVAKIEDFVSETANGGLDTLKLRANSSNLSKISTITLPANVENLDASATGLVPIALIGNSAANKLIGNDTDNLLDGAAGADTMIGGAGDDTYLIDSAEDLVTELLGEGSDTVQVKIGKAGGTYTLPSNVENGVLKNVVAFSLIGNALHNYIIGNSAANTLTGQDGNDTLDGKAGADTLMGGLGSDTYFVDAVGDVVTEEVNAGIDEICSSISFDLSTRGGSVEKLSLLGANPIHAIGNELDNTITGNSGANLLDGGQGADSLNGGKGNDAYYVDNVGDVVTETFADASGGGVDTVRSNISYALGENLNHLILVGSAATGTGNDLNNKIMGNDGDNVLNGRSGIDTLTGGLGNDTYLIDLVRNGSTTTVKLEDLIAEKAGEGTDTVQLHLSGGVDNYAFMTSATTLVLGANLENQDASLTGSLKLNLTGNVLSNTLTGNDGDNVLDGGTGVDTLVGGKGNDTYVVENIADAVRESTGEGSDSIQVKITEANGTFTLADNIENATLFNKVSFSLVGNKLDNILTGNSFANTLTGGDGQDTLNGGLGKDTLIGGVGTDSFVIDSVLSMSNMDTIQDFQTGNDHIILSTKIFTKLFGLTDFTDNFVSKNGAKALDSNDYLLFDTLTGTLFYDSDGAGKGAAVVVCQLVGGGNLLASDLTVI